jgi:hypothetical protein
MSAAILWAILAASPAPAEPRDPEDLLREAFYAEVVRCDPREALALYRAALARPAIPARAAGVAHLRAGICLHLLEDFAAAEAEFRTVTADFPGEADAVLTARRYLGHAPRDPSRFMPPDVAFYTELVEPGRQAGFLSDVIRGTPLENPVDSYLLARPGSTPQSQAAEGAPPEAAPQLEQLRAILNLSVLKELQKIEGIAIGSTSLDAARPGWLLVFLPGSSDLSRVLIKSILPAAMDRAVPETLNGLRIFKLKKDALHVAMDEAEEVLLLGASREIVMDAIRRGVPGGAGPRPPSLSEVEDFRRAQAARSGSMLFVYADRQKLVSAIRAGTPPGERGAFDEVCRLLGLDQLRSLAATVARTGDDLRITIRSRLDPERHPLWPVFRTPPLGQGLMSFVPEGSLFFLASGLTEGSSRWTRLRAALEPVIGGLPASPERLSISDLLRFLDVDLGLDFGSDILDELRGVVFGAPPRVRFPGEASFYVLLEFRDGETAQPRVEKLLAALARRTFGPDASAEFKDDPPRGDVRLRAFEPRPGFRILYARQGSTFILSPLWAVILDCLDARSSGPSFDRAQAPALASKVLVLAPQALRARNGPRPPRDEGDLLLSHLPRAIFFTEESPDALAVELRIPGMTQVLRETLKELPLPHKEAEAEAGKK